MDPAEPVLMGTLCRGEDDPGSESLNFELLLALGDSFVGNCFLVCCEDKVD